jgi:hypothetical protein
MDHKLAVLVRAVLWPLLFLAATWPALTSCSIGLQNRHPNVVAQFLGRADRQYESEAQRVEMMHALDDMLTKPAADLRKQRYADHQGNRDAWSLTTLLRRYFVPTVHVADWDLETFYRDLSGAEAREAIRQQLSALKQERAAH